MRDKIKEITIAEYEIKRELSRELRETEDKVRNEIWAMDIDPDAFFERPVEDVAKDRMNYEERFETLEEIAGELRTLTLTWHQLTKKWIPAKVEKYEEWGLEYRKEFYERMGEKLTESK